MGRKGRLALREGEEEGEGCSKELGASAKDRTPHVNPLPLARGEAEQWRASNNQRTLPLIVLAAAWVKVNPAGLQAELRDSLTTPRHRRKSVVQLSSPLIDVLLCDRHFTPDTKGPAGDF